MYMYIYIYRHIMMYVYIYIYTRSNNVIHTYDLLQNGVPRQSRRA